MASTLVHLTEHMSPHLDGRGSDVFNQAKRLHHFGDQIIIAGRWSDNQKHLERLENTLVYRVDFLSDLPGIPWAIKRYAIARSLVNSMVSKFEGIIGSIDGDIALLGHHLYGGVAAAKIAKSCGFPTLWVLYGTEGAYGFLTGLEESVLIRNFEGDVSCFLLLEDGSSLIPKVRKLVPGKRCFIFNQAPSDEFEGKGKVNSSRKEESNPRVFTYISTSSMIKCKGVGYIIKAFHKIHRDQQSRLILLGDGPLRPRYEDFVRRKGVSKKVSFLGRVPPGLVRDHLLDSDVLVAASPNISNFGRNVMEAMSLGIPVIVMDGERTSDLLSDEENCLIVKRKDVDALARSMMELYADEDLRRRLAGEAAAFAVDAFSWEKRNETFDRALGQLLS